MDTDNTSQLIEELIYLKESEELLRDLLRCFFTHEGIFVLDGIISKKQKERLYWYSLLNIDERVRKYTNKYND